MDVTQLNKSGLRVTGEMVLLRMPKMPTHTAGGIALPQITQDKEEIAQQIGTLLGAGSRAFDFPSMEGIEPGMVVTFPRYAGQYYTVDGIKYVILRAKDVLGEVTKLPDFHLNAAASSVEVFGVNRVEAAA